MFFLYCSVALSAVNLCKSPVLPAERCWSVAGAVKKIITARYRSPPFYVSWPPLRQRRIRSAFADCPSYRSESFELHKILRAVRRGHFSTLAKFNTAPTTPVQSFAPLDEARFGPLGQCIIFDLEPQLCLLFSIKIGGHLN